MQVIIRYIPVSVMGTSTDKLYCLPTVNDIGRCIRPQTASGRDAAGYNKWLDFWRGAVE